MDATIDVRRSQLFLDEQIIEHSVRFRRIVHQPHKYYGNGVYVANVPWEGRGMWSTLRECT